MTARCLRYAVLGKCLALLSACQADQDYVVSAGYTGPVVVVYETPGGVPRTRTLRIPTNGILFVKDESSTSGRFRVLEEMSNGERREIEHLKTEPNAFQYFNFVTLGKGSASGCLPNGESSPVRDTFVLGRPRDRDRLVMQQEDLVNRATADHLRRRSLAAAADCVLQRTHPGFLK